MRRLEGQMCVIDSNGLVSDASKMTFYSEIKHKFSSNDVNIQLYTNVILFKNETRTIKC